MIRLLSYWKFCVVNWTNKVVIIDHSNSILEVDWRNEEAWINDLSWSEGPLEIWEAATYNQ